MKIDFQYRPEISCDYHRIQLPFQYMGLSADRRATLSVFCRIPVRSPATKYIVDIDDYWYLYPHHYIFNRWQQNGTGRQMIEYMKTADAVTTTNTVLADKIARYNKNVYVVPNALPFDQGQFKMSVSESNICRFFYAGGASHAYDLDILFDAIKDDRWVDLTIQGYQKDNTTWQGIRQKFGYRAKFIDNQHIDSYLNTYEADVMLIPLENNIFNQHKSNLKVLEAAAKGMAVIASRIHPYYNYLDMPHVLYADTPQEWISNISFCSSNPGFVKEQAHALREHCMAHYELTQANNLRREIYRKYL